jgi:hypothetical protein
MAATNSLEKRRERDERERERSPKFVIWIRLFCIDSKGAKEFILAKVLVVRAKQAIRVETFVAMEVLAGRAASSAAAAAVMRRQEGASCSYNGCNRSSQNSDASCALSR